MIELSRGQRRIICIGNPFVAGDDLGPRVFAELVKRPLPEGTIVIDGGLSGIDLLRFVEGAGRVVFVDALENFGKPGEIVTLDGPFPDDEGSQTYSHQGGFGYLLRIFSAVCDGELPPVSVVGLEGVVSDETVGRVADQALLVAAHESLANDLFAGKPSPADDGQHKDALRERIDFLEKENAVLREEVRTGRQAAAITARLVVEQFNNIEETNTRLAQLASRVPPEEAVKLSDLRSERGKLVRQELIETRKAAELTAKLVSEQFEETERVLRHTQEIAAQLELRNDFIKSVFGRYVTDQVVNSILSEPAGLELGGERRPVTVLMSDLRGFTAMAERLKPEQVVAILNNYLAAMTEVINVHSGTINEFIGDAILAIFGAPVGRSDDTERAVACALDMQLKMRSVNRWNREHGLPEIEMGIGLNSGEVVVGNIGCQLRMKYGTVGTPVNLTARVEAATVGGQVLVSNSTLNAIDCEVQVAQTLHITAKGLKEPIEIHEITGLGGKYNFYLPLAEQEYVKLAPPLPCRCKIFEGKHSTVESFSASIVELSRQRARLATGELLTPLVNLKLLFRSSEGDSLADEVYAKVITDDEAKTLTTVVFTSVGPASRCFLDAFRPAF